MPIVRLLYNNHGIAIDSIWDAKSQVASLPACHLGDQNRQRVARSTGAGTCDWWRVGLCSTALSVDRVAFVSANLTSCAYIGIEAHCTSCFDDGVAPPGFTTCFAPWAASRSKITFHDLSSKQTKKWWRFLVCDTGVDAGYYEVGVIALGPATCMRISPSKFRYAIEDPSLVEYTSASTPKTYLRDPFAVVELPHTLLAETLVFDGLQDVIRDGGQRKDMVFSLYTSEPACTCQALATNLYGRFDDPMRFMYQTPGNYEATLRFRESL